MNSVNTNNQQNGSVRQPNQQQGQNQQQPQAPQIPLGKIFLGYMIINFIWNQFASPGNPQQNPYLIGNYIEQGEKFDVVMKIQKNEEILSTWTEKDVTYDYSSANFRENNFTIPYDAMISEPYPILTISLSSQTRDLILYNETDIIKLKVKKEEKDLKNLIFSSNSTEQEELKRQEEEKQRQDELQKQKQKYSSIKPKVLVPHYRPKIYVYFIKDDNIYHKTQMPPPMHQMETVQEGNATFYKPFIDTTQWWLREVDYKPLNQTDGETVKDYNVQVQFDTYWSFKFVTQNSLVQSSQMYEKMGVDIGGPESFDMIKEMLVDNSPYYLAVTFTVSILHSLFEFLAMKNDVMFWRNLQTHQGISLRSLYTNFIMDIIIFLYLVDSEETSYMILIPSFIEIFITVWKILKTTNVSRISVFPYIRLRPKQDIYINTTEKYDKVAVKWMYICLLPCFAAYIGYSLYYEKHKGWYSFVLNTFVGFIYLFGFINMTPQLYINYKLKSVDHLPWRTMIYKFLNTIVDDFFAFAISMPWLKRLSCFRDDVIFVIYIYQRWIYRVDPRRTQHGFVKDELVPTNPQPQNRQEEDEQNSQNNKQKTD